MRKHDRYGKPATPYLEALRSPDFWQEFNNKKMNVLTLRKGLELIEKNVYP
jgi:hypothetical protein